MKDFVLAAWEVPHSSDAPLSAPVEATTEVRWCGQIVEMAIRTVPIPHSGNYVFFRPLESSDDGSWIVTEADEACPKITNKLIPRLKRLVRRAIGSREGASYGRFINWDEAHAVVIRPSATSGWLRNFPGSHHEFPESFRLPASSNEILSWSASQTRVFLQNQVADPISDAFYCYQWTFKHYEERVAQVYGVHRVREAEQVMKWVLLNAKELHEHCPSWLWQLKTEDRGGSCLSCMGAGKSLEIADAPRLLAWHRFLSQRYLPQREEELIQEHACVAEFYEYFATFATARITQMPTAHEQNEAASCLREWLRDKASPAEIEALVAS